MKILVLMLLLVQAYAEAQVRRDPFARPAGAVAVAVTAEEAAPAPLPPPPPPRLRAVMYEPGKSLVNINGRILAVGDTFEDYRVAAIGANSATLTRRGVRSVIVLDEESSK